MSLEPRRIGTNVFLLAELAKEGVNVGITPFLHNFFRDMIKVLYVPQNKYDGNPFSTRQARTMFFSSQEHLDAFIQRHFSQPAVHHTLPEGLKVMGYTRYIQEYDPMHFNDAAMRLFAKFGIEEYPGSDECGILGNILFY